MTSNAELSEERRVEATFGSSQESRVEATFGSPERQSRVTVFFRLILLLPHVVVLAFRGVIVEVLLVVGWFAALFTARVPARIAHYFTRYITYVARVNAYHLLLLDEYPPFNLDRDDYPVHVAVHPVTLNRWSVLFRMFLVIPAAFVAGLFAFGAGVAAIASWFIILVTGKMPEALHGANAAVLRYSARYTAYACMVSSEYPHRLYGDGPKTPLADTPYPFQADGSVDATTTADSLGALADSDAGSDLDSGRAEDRWPLVLSRSGRRTLTLFGVLGPVAYAALFVIVLVTGSAVRSNPAIALPLDRAALSSAIETYHSATTACATDLACIQHADSHLADAFASFGSQVSSLSFAPSATTSASTLVSESAQFESVLRTLARTDRAHYEATAAGLTEIGNAFDSTYAQVLLDLR